MLTKKNTMLYEIIKKKNFTTKEILSKCFNEFPPSPLNDRFFNDEPLMVLPETKGLVIYESLIGLCKNFKLIFRYSYNQQNVLSDIKKIYSDIIKDTVKKSLNNIKRNASVNDIFLLCISLTASYIQALIILILLTTLLTLCFPFGIFYFIAILLRNLLRKSKFESYAFATPFKTKANRIYFSIKNNKDRSDLDIFSTLSHETIHILQKTNDKELLIKSNLIKKTINIKEKYRNDGATPLAEYYTKPPEIEAYLHEELINLYKKIGCLPSSKLEFVLTSILYFNLSTLLEEESEHKLMDFCFDNIKDTKTAKYLKKLNECKNIKKTPTPIDMPLIYFSEESDKIKHLLKELPARYAMLIELYGDKELADRIRSEPDIEYHENQGFVFSILINEELDDKSMILDRETEAGS